MGAWSVVYVCAAMKRARIVWCMLLEEASASVLLVGALGITASLAIPT
jgi:hypothetical protein